MTLRLVTPVLAIASAIAFAGCCNVGCPDRSAPGEQQYVVLRATPLEDTDGAQVLIESSVLSKRHGKTRKISAPSLVANVGPDHEASIAVAETTGDGKIDSGITMRFVAELTDGGTTLAVRYAHWEHGRRVHRIPLTRVEVPPGKTVRLAATRVRR